MQLTLKPAWLEPGFWPADLFDAPFEEFEATPRFVDVLQAKTMHPGWTNLDAFAEELLAVVAKQLSEISGQIHLKCSGGYDSRILAYLLWVELGNHDVLFITDGEEEPEATATLDFLEVPQANRYLHDLSGIDPYQLVSATVLGWAPIYHQMVFTPPQPMRAGATLVTGLGGGEWFSYPAAGWHRSRQHRIEHLDLRNMWIDTWPQYWLLPDRWAEGYKAAVHPYTTPEYAYVANGCNREWLFEVDGFQALDRVRKAMLDQLDRELAHLGWKPHVYDWRLDEDACKTIDDRFHGSWLFQELLGPGPVNPIGRPSWMHEDEYACLMGGFAQWCDALIAQGHEISVAS